MRNYLRLRTIKGLGEAKITELVKARGTLDGIFDEDPSQLLAYGLDASVVRGIVEEQFDDTLVNDEIGLCENYGFNFIRFEDDDYPPLLKEAPDAPPFLFHSGKKEPLTMPSIAIVGSRRAATAATKFTQKIARDLAEVGFNIVSGFAYGIDIHAHLGAVGAGMTTAVMGTGLLKVYPEAHKKYARDILENGCFLSELSARDVSGPHGFPRRNRIISGMSYGILVVEAGQKSGSLITARLATEQGREVFAVPSWPDQFNNATNGLIKNGAKLVETYLDIVEEFTYLLDTSRQVKPKPDNDSMVFDSFLKRKIYETVGVEPMGQDSLCHRFASDIGELLTALTELELEGIIFKDTDGKYRIGGDHG